MGWRLAGQQEAQGLKSEANDLWGSLPVHGTYDSRIGVRPPSFAARNVGKNMSRQTGVLGPARGKAAAIPSS